MGGDMAPADPVQAGYRAGRLAAAAERAGRHLPAARPALLARAALACVCHAAVLPAPPMHDAAITRARFVWSFVLGYEEQAAKATPLPAPALAGRRT